MIANKYRGTLQIGVTANVHEFVADKKREARERAEGDLADMTGVLLVWMENHAQMAGARVREEELKRLSRDFKLGLIERKNPSWRDLHVPVKLRSGFSLQAPVSGPARPSGLFRKAPSWNHAS